MAASRPFSPSAQPPLSLAELVVTALASRSAMVPPQVPFPVCVTRCGQGVKTCTRQEQVCWVHPSLKAGHLPNDDQLLNTRQVLPLGPYGTSLVGVLSNPHFLQ